MEASIAVLLSSIDDYITLPVYQQQDGLQQISPTSAETHSNSSRASSPATITATTTDTTTTSAPHALSSASIASSITSIQPSSNWLKKDIPTQK